MSKAVAVQGQVKYSLKKKTVNREVQMIEFKSQDVPLLSNLDELNDDPFLQELKNLFEKRVIWSRKALEAHVENRKDLKKMQSYLSHVAYSFKNGPWRGMWVKFGFDPRLRMNRQASARYQAIDFRLKRKYSRKKQQQESVVPLEYVDMDETFMKRMMPYRKNASSSLASSSVATAAENDDNKSREDEEESYKQQAYVFDSIPRRYQTVFQICDIRLKDVQEIVENRCINRTCDEKSGWYPKEAIQEIRKIMKQKVEHWIKNGEDGDDEQLLSESSDDDQTGKRKRVLAADEMEATTFENSAEQSSIPLESASQELNVPLAPLPVDFLEELKNNKDLQEVLNNS